MPHKLSHLTNRALPDNIREEYPQFTLFIDKYFEYISRELGEYDLATNLLDYINIDKTIDTFYEDFKKKYVPLLPEKYKASLATIVKNANSFYQTKGTEESFKTFFRMVFDSTVELYYPKNDMLRASDGKWIQPYYLYPTEQDYDTLTYYYDKRIIGSVTNSTAYVEKISQITDPADINNKIWVVSLVDRNGTFNSTDIITVEGENDPSFALDSNDAIISGTGYWEGTDGFLSWNKYIQDSDYYQDYSYVLETNIAVELYEKPVKENLHPAGLKFFGRLVEGISIIEVGNTLSDIIHNIIQWISLENVEHELDSTPQILKQQSVAPNNSSGEDFDWRYFEDHREEEPFLSIFKLPELGALPIEHISNNYSENFLTVIVRGVTTTEYTILNELVTLDEPMEFDGFVHITTNAKYTPVKNREYKFYGQAGQSAFILPTIINPMNSAPSLPDSLYIETTREIATFTGSEYGELIEPIVFSADLKIDVEISTTNNNNIALFSNSADTHLFWIESGTGHVKARIQKADLSYAFLANNIDVRDGKVHKLSLIRIGSLIRIDVDDITGTPNDLGEIPEIAVDLIGSRPSSYQFRGQILSTRFKGQVNARTNLAIYSEDLDLWTGNSGGQVSKDEHVFIDGQNTMDLVYNTSNFPYEGVYSNVNINPFTEYRVSVYIARKDSDLCRIGLYNVAHAWHGYIDINLNTMLIGGNLGSWDMKVEHVIDDIYRASFWFTTLGDITDINIQLHSDRNATNKGAYFGGVMITEGQELLDYHRTYNLPVTVHDEFDDSYVFDSGSELYELVEDKSLGVELSGDPTCDNESYWDITNGTTFDGDGVDINYVGAGNAILQRKSSGEPLTVGETIVCTLEFSSYTSGILHIYAGNGIIGITSGGGSFEFVGVVTTDGRLQINSNGFVGTISKFSYRKLPDSTCLLNGFTEDNWKTYISKRNVEYDDGTIFRSWLGDNLVINGTFDTDTVWTKVRASISEGKAILDGEGSYNAISQNINVTGLRMLIGVEILVNGVDLQVNDTPNFPLIGTTIGTHKIIHTFAGNAIALYEPTYNNLMELDNVLVQHLLEVVHR